MSILDKTTTTVDATLTTKGRLLLAEGGSFDISYFCLTDQGIDYRKHNETSPSGSTYYGKALTDMPLLEASVHAEHSFTNKLVSLPPNIDSLPVITGLDNKSFGAMIYDHTWTPTMVGTSYSGTYQWIIGDTTNVTPTGVTQDDSISVLSQIYHPDQAMAQPGSFTGKTLTLRPHETNFDVSFLVTVIANNGIWGSFTVSWGNNILRRAVTDNPKG